MKTEILLKDTIDIWTILVIKVTDDDNNSHHEVVNIKELPDEFVNDNNPKYEYTNGIYVYRTNNKIPEDLLIDNIAERFEGTPKIDIDWNMWV